jgi:hypothetical protein
MSKPGEVSVIGHGRAVTRGSHHLELNLDPALDENEDNDTVYGVCIPQVFGGAVMRLRGRIPSRDRGEVGRNVAACSIKRDN